MNTQPARKSRPRSIIVQFLSGISRPPRPALSPAMATRQKFQLPRSFASQIHIRLPSLLIISYLHKPVRHITSDPKRKMSFNVKQEPNLNQQTARRTWMDEGTLSHLRNFYASVLPGFRKQTEVKSGFYSGFFFASGLFSKGLCSSVSH